MVSQYEDTHSIFLRAPHTREYHVHRHFSISADHKNIISDLLLYFKFKVRINRSRNPDGNLHYMQAVHICGIYTSSENVSFGQRKSFVAINNIYIGITFRLNTTRNDILKYNIALWRINIYRLEITDNEVGVAYPLFQPHFANAGTFHLRELICQIIRLHSKRANHVRQCARHCYSVSYHVSAGLGQSV